MNKTINELINTQKSDLNILGHQTQMVYVWQSQNTFMYVNSQLRSYGLAVEDRVAIVLPNGPEMASAFLTMAQSCTTAPLNPNYREEEYLFYLRDLNAKALVVLKDYNGPALAAAIQLNILVVRMSVNSKHSVENLSFL